MELQKINLRHVCQLKLPDKMLQDIISVINRSDVSQRKIARHFHVHHSTISRDDGED